MLSYLQLCVVLGDMIDVISIDAESGRIPWLFKQKLVQACVTAGLTFELSFSKALTSTENRRQVSITKYFEY